MQPVRLPAFVAKFPFTRGPSADGKQELAPPEFVEATVTELAGPGLRIEVPFEAGVGERVLVIMRLDQLQRHGPADQQEIVQDIGQVRHSEAIENRCSVAVELTGLSDSDLNKLVLATNAASRNAAQAGEDASASPENSARRVAGDDTDPGGESPEAVAVQEKANA